MILPHTSEVNQQVQLAGGWRVWALPRHSQTPLESAPPDSAINVPPCAHLQPALFPERPFWGAHLRALNEQDWLYHQTFRTPVKHFQRARLICEGIDYFASVWLNGVFLADHEGHFAPFSMDVTRILRHDTDNALRIRVSSPWDNRTPKGTYPIDHVLRGLVKGLYEHGEGLIPPDVNPIGIWRPVWLAFDDGVSVERALIQGGSDGSVRLQLLIENATDYSWDGTLAIEIDAENHTGPGAVLSRALRLPHGTHTIEQVLQIPDPRLWWPWDQGEPSLYRLRVALSTPHGHIISQREEIFGLRKVELDRSRQRFTYRVNDRPVFVRGTSYIPGIYLSACDRASICNDIELARQANLNLLRAHVHVSPPEFYDLCDRKGMLVWQDFELNWTHDPSPAFEARALCLQREMIELLYNHPSIITWACHNEPTMLFTRRENLEEHPDPALYAEAKQQDPSRPVFLCSGQMEDDWQRSGDSHSYLGALWSRRYTDIYRRRVKLNTEFGFEAPAAPETLQAHPDVWERLKHLEGVIEPLWEYQAELTQYHIEHFRRLRAESCAGYIHFWLADLVPQVGCGILDSHRRAKGGYDAVRRASAPLQIALEHDGRRPHALWVFNDTPQPYADCIAEWHIYDTQAALVHQGRMECRVAANASQRLIRAEWPISPAACEQVILTLKTRDGTQLACNRYAHPFRPTPRPRGYPWKFDPYLACKVFDRPDAPSLADVGSGGGLRLIPLAWRENIAEWILRQRLPIWLLSGIARFVRLFGQGNG